MAHNNNFDFCLKSTARPICLLPSNTITKLKYPQTDYCFSAVLVDIIASHTQQQQKFCERFKTFI